MERLWEGYFFHSCDPLSGRAEIFCFIFRLLMDSDSYVIGSVTFNGMLSKPLPERFRGMDCVSWRFSNVVRKGRLAPLPFLNTLMTLKDCDSRNLPVAVLFASAFVNPASLKLKPTVAPMAAVEESVNGN